MDVTARILSCYLSDRQSVRVESLGSAGGLSGAQFWRITVSGSPDLAQPRTFILRRWPQEHPTPDRLRFIHAAIYHAAERGVTFLPLPIRTTTGASFVHHAGYLWELAPWLPGAADYEKFPSTIKLQSAMQSLARVHVALADFPIAARHQLAGPSPSVTSRLSRLQELQSGGADVLARAVNDVIWPDLAPLARQFLASLPSAVARAINELAPLAGVQFSLQPCLRDVWHDHVLFSADRVTGIVDFGAMDVDTPACDIGRLLGSLAAVPCSPAISMRAALPLDVDPEETAKRGLSPSLQHETAIWQAGLAAYSTIRPLTPVEVRAARALDVSGTVLAGCNWLRWIYVDERRFENRGQVMERISRITARLERQ